MINWIKISLSIIFLAIGIFFATVSVNSIERRIQKLQEPGSNTWVEEYDIQNPNKGSFMIGYSVMAGCCLVASAIMFASMRKKGD